MKKRQLSKLVAMAVFMGELGYGNCAWARDIAPTPKSGNTVIVKDSSCPSMGHLMRAIQ